MTLAIARAGGSHARFHALAPMVAQQILHSGSPTITYDILGIRVLLSWDLDQWVAVEPGTGLFGEGDEPNDALRDLMSTLLDHARDLQAHRGRMAPEYEGQLAKLAHLLPR